MNEGFSSTLLRPFEQNRNGAEDFEKRQVDKWGGWKKLAMNQGSGEGLHADILVGAKSGFAQFTKNS